MANNNNELNSRKDKKGPDRFQQAAIDATINSVVSAGAGSGKTTVLSLRFLDLVQNRGMKVEEVLTLTFTKKATVEMSSRIYKVLKANNPDKAADFHKANIKTLDSYCNSVAKLGARYYGVSPDFVQDEEAVKEKALEMALPFILEHRDNEAIKVLVQTKNYADIATQLFVEPVIKLSTVAEPVDFRQCVLSQLETVIQEWNSRLPSAESAVMKLKSLTENYTGKSSAYISKFEEFFKNNVLPLFPELQLEDVVNDTEKNLSAMEEFYGKGLSVSKISQNGARSECFQEIKETHNLLRDVLEPAAGLVDYVAGLKYYQALIPLMTEFQDRINDFKRSAGILTFKDTASLALCILRDYPELRQIEKEKYKAIMIDEFQDNNSMQRDLLFLLSENPDRREKGIPSVSELCPEKLFFVGDEKQSIYKFRGADVSVFRGLSKDFEKGNLTMTTNYRSVPALISAFNSIFGGFPYPGDCRSTGETARPSVFYPETTDKEVPEFEAVYKEVAIPEGTDLSVPGLFKPHVHFAFYDGEQEIEPSEEKNLLIKEDAEAMWVCSKIKDIIENGINGVKYSSSQIAILFRNYNLQPLYERSLLSLSVPYSTECLTGFFSDGPVNDIYSFLRLCVFERDTMSYAEVLSSPFVNLSIVEVNSILAEKKSPFQAEGLCLREDSRKRYEAAGEFFLELKKASSSRLLTDLLDMLWYYQGYRYETIRRKDISSYSKLYDYLYELAREAQLNNMSLASFIESLKEYTDEKKKLNDMDIPLESAEGVRLMSIHKSKGLEFPVVFVVGSQKKSQHDKNASPVYMTEKYGPVFNAPGSRVTGNETKGENYFYKKISGIENKKDSAELKRLVYVAMTRAEKELFVTNGNWKYDSEAVMKYACGGEKSPETIYNVLEPFVNSFKTDDEEFAVNPESPFDVEFILPQKRTAFREASEERNLDEAEKLYSQANFIQKESVPGKYTAPSSLHDYCAEDTESTDSISCAPEELLAAEGVEYPQINEIVASTVVRGAGGEYHSPKFGFNNFGTIAHAFLEAKVAGKDPYYSQREVAGLEGDENKIKMIESIAGKMAYGFAQSQLGQMAMKDSDRKCEYPFKTYAGSTIVRGVIDLVFRAEDGTFIIVDYKTDQKEKDELYYRQQACYRKAVSEMEGVSFESVRCYLYYLRYGTVSEITEHCTMEAISL